MCLVFNFHALLSYLPELAEFPETSSSNQNCKSILAHGQMSLGSQALEDLDIQLGMSKSRGPEREKPAALAEGAVTKNMFPNG